MRGPTSKGREGRNDGFKRGMKWFVDETSCRAFMFREVSREEEKEGATAGRICRRGRL